VEKPKGKRRLGGRPEETLPGMYFIGAMMGSTVCLGTVEKSVMLLSGIEGRLLGRATLSVVTIPAGPARFFYVQYM
jgi:hypothetical protein